MINEMIKIWNGLWIPWPLDWELLNGLVVNLLAEIKSDLNMKTYYNWMALRLITVILSVSVRQIWNLKIEPYDFNLILYQEPSLHQNQTFGGF